jgi:hypothetical protein
MSRVWPPCLSMSSNVLSECRSRIVASMQRLFVCSLNAVRKWNSVVEWLLLQQPEPKAVLICGQDKVECIKRDIIDWPPCRITAVPDTTRLFAATQ